MKLSTTVSGDSCYEQRDYRMGNARGSYKYQLQPCGHLQYQKI